MSPVFILVSPPWEPDRQFWASVSNTWDSQLTKRKGYAASWFFRFQNMICWPQCCGPLVANHGGSMGQNKTSHLMGSNWEEGSSHNHVDQTSYSFHHLSPMLGTKLSPHRPCGDIPDANDGKRIHLASGFVKQLELTPLSVLSWMFLSLALSCGSWVRSQPGL